MYEVCGVALIGKTIASGGMWDYTVKLWDTQTQMLKRTLRVDDQVNAVAFSADGNLIASAAGNEFMERLEAEVNALVITLT